MWTPLKSDLNVPINKGVSFEGLALLQYYFYIKMIYTIVMIATSNYKHPSEKHMMKHIIKYAIRA